MANQSDILSNKFNSNTYSGLLSADTNIGLTSISRTKEGSIKFSLIHQHTYKVIKEDKLRTKKRYLYKYYSLDNLEGWHALIIGLCGHLKRMHDTIWSWEENESRITVRDEGEELI